MRFGGSGRCGWAAGACNIGREGGGASAADLDDPGRDPRGRRRISVRALTWTILEDSTRRLLLLVAFPAAYPPRSRADAEPGVLVIFVEERS